MALAVTSAERQAAVMRCALAADIMHLVQLWYGILGPPEVVPNAS